MLDCSLISSPQSILVLFNKVHGLSLGLASFHFQGVEQLGIFALSWGEMLALELSISREDGLQLDADTILLGLRCEVI